MMQHGLLTALAVCALLAGGCFETDQQLMIRGDGSGTLTETTYFSAETIKTMEGMSKAFTRKKEGEGEPAEPRPVGPSPAIVKMLDKAKLAQKAAALGKGVTVKSAKALTEADGRQGIRIVYAFTDISKISLDSQPGASRGAAGAKKGGKAIRFAFAKGRTPKLTVLMPMPPEPEGGDKPAPVKKAPTTRPTSQEARRAAMVKAMFKDFRFTVGVTVDGTISKTNATRVDKARKTVTLIQMDIGGMLKDKAVANKIEGLEPAKSLRHMHDELKKRGVTKYIFMEPKQKVEIEFKRGQKKRP